MGKGAFQYPTSANSTILQSSASLGTNTKYLEEVSPARVWFSIDMTE